MPLIIQRLAARLQIHQRSKQPPSQHAQLFTQLQHPALLLLHAVVCCSALILRIVGALLCVADGRSHLPRSAHICSRT